MNTTKLYKIIRTLSLTGIDTAILDNVNNDLLIRGVDKDGVTFVFHTIDGNDISTKPIGLETIQPLVNKMKLINLDNVNAVLEEDENNIKRVTFKEGRKKVTHTFINPTKLSVPKNIAFDEIKNSIVLSKSAIDNIGKVLSTFQSETVSLSGIGTDIVMKVEDKDSNTFEDVIGTNSEGDWHYAWQRDKFIKLIKTSLAENESESVQLVISAKGILYFDINDIIIMLFPSPE
jgi:hypothetical protein